MDGVLFKFVFCLVSSFYFFCVLFICLLLWSWIWLCLWPHWWDPLLLYRIPKKSSKRPWECLIKVISHTLLEIKWRINANFITGDAIQINKKVLSTKKIPFQPHPAGKRLIINQTHSKCSNTWSLIGNASWLGMNFDFQYVKPVFDILNSTQVPLLNRGIFVHDTRSSLAN